MHEPEATAELLKKLTEEEGVDLDKVNEYLLEKEHGELSFNELVAYQSGTSFSRAQVQKLHRRWHVLAKGNRTATPEDVSDALPHTLRDNFVLARMLDAVSEGGVITFGGFVKLMAPFEQTCDPAAQQQLLFHIYDTDGDGRISAADFRGFLREQFAAINLSPSAEVYDQIANDTFAELDTDRDGYLLPGDLSGLAAESLEQMVLAFT